MGGNGSIVCTGDTGLRNNTGSSVGLRSGCSIASSTGDDTRSSVGLHLLFAPLLDRNESGLATTGSIGAETFPGLVVAECLCIWLVEDLVGEARLRVPVSRCWLANRLSLGALRFGRCERG